MCDSSDVQALEKISSDVDESQIKIILSSHCIKAQAFLVDKLRKQTERQKEICIFISNSNVKLEAEIKQAEQEIQSLRSAYETIRSANVELRKELLLAKENKIDIEEHVKVGEKKYEDMWLECKGRFESIPYVQKLLQARNTAQMFGNDINGLQNEGHRLVNEIDAKSTELMYLDRKRVIELANYIVNERPLKLNIIKEKMLEINTLTQEIGDIEKIRKDKENKNKNMAPVEVKTAAPSSGDLNISTKDNWPNLCTSSEQSLLIPQLKLVGSDLDVLSVKLDQIKIKKVEMQQTTPIKRIDSVLGDNESPLNKRAKKSEENMLYYFSKPPTVEESNDIQTKCNFSKRKLINILEDIKLDKNDTYKLVSQVNVENLKDINAIGSDAINGIDAATIPEKIFQVGTPIESEQIEEIDLTTRKSGSIEPPTQFMDYTQENIIRTSQQTAEVMAESGDNNINSLKNSQENFKKKVSFDLPSSIQIIPVDDEDGDEGEVYSAEAETNKTANSDLDTSGVSDDGFNKIREMILKKHKLDLSPQFVYAKNTTIKMRNDDNVTSKFFQQSKATVIDVQDVKVLKESVVKNVRDNDELEEMQHNNETGNIVENDENIDVSNIKIQELQKAEKPVSGFLFKHGTQEIPDSLNVSISTTGFDEGEADFPHCIDTSLLLSPKADLPMPMSGDNADVLSQEVPNFLTGLRKTGLSFFGLSSASETKTDNNAQDASNNFNFNFGGGEKKPRGGLFSMFR